ncbi:MAG: SMC-Scp complex subunit ScpB, partial [Myxococcota bacterium]|nr:SMC-Scp complex subunit ScpB [Myxococcota bacterium]
AYRQPATRAEVEELRGVDSGGVLRSLCERGLLRVCGRRQEPGRPQEFATTPRFLEIFSLRDLAELPNLRDLRELQRDDPRDNPGIGDPAQWCQQEIPWQAPDGTMHLSPTDAPPTPLSH